MKKKFVLGLLTVLLNMTAAAQASDQAIDPNSEQALGEKSEQMHQARQAANAKEAAAADAKEAATADTESVDQKIFRMPADASF